MKDFVFRNDTRLYFRNDICDTLADIVRGQKVMRDVTEDIPGLIDFFLYRHAKDNNEPKKHLDASALKALKLHPWPGNIRELHNVIILAAYNTEGETISENDLDISASAPSPKTSLLLKDPDKDRDRIIEAYRRGGSWSAAAKLLGISERTLLEQPKRYGFMTACSLKSYESNPRGRTRFDPFYSAVGRNRVSQVHYIIKGEAKHLA